MASWTEKRVERLKLFHKEGFSATLIARKLGPSFTKGMVAGKIRRLGLTVKPMKKGSALQRKPAPSHTAPPISKAQPRKPLPALAHPILVSRPQVRSSPPLRPMEPINGLQIFDLRETHCRWPLGNDRPAKFFCGAPTIAAKSWCEHHYRLAYGHRPTHQDRQVGKSPGQTVLQGLQRRSESRQGNTVQRST